MTFLTICKRLVYLIIIIENNILINVINYNDITDIDMSKIMI